jgi:aspartate racemase
MKTIGIIGGLTWYSTVEYYKLFNSMVNERVGGVASAKVIIHSVNFAEIKSLTEQQDWNAIATMMCDAGKKIEAAGADCLLLGANTMHKIADEVQEAISIPLINIAEAVADSIVTKGVQKVALLGTKYTMQLDFYTKKLSAKGIETMLPNEGDMEFINKALYNEMSIGLFLPETKQRFIAIINDLVAKGAQGIIGGCTEIPILINQKDISVPLFDTGYIHAKAAVDFALSK